jgi:hypothetical protein
LAEVFRGNREIPISGGGSPAAGRKIFDGLKIAATGYAFDKHPVLSFSMALGSQSPDHLEQSIRGMVGRLARSENIKLESEDYAGLLPELIMALYNKKKSKKK